MKQTNYLLFDFLDFDPTVSPDKTKRRLWKAGRPIGFEEKNGGVIIHLPFQCQLPGNDLAPDPEVESAVQTLEIKAYGEKILRLTLDLEGFSEKESAMLQEDIEKQSLPLIVEQHRNHWLVNDANGNIRARFDFKPASKDHWSDLLPPPEESLEAVFYPDSKKAVRIHAYDQFFPARNDAMALAYIVEGEEIISSTLSFHAKPDEKFVGTGERFAKMDLSGKTVQLKNQDGQGVNNRRTYKNVPFYLSSEMYGTFLHTTAFSKLSLADHSTRSVQLLAEEPGMDLFLIGGDTPEEILYHYRGLTGFPSLPPLWSFGIWMSRMTYFSAVEVEEICERLRKEDYPCDVIHLDTGWFRTDWLCEWKFNAERFPDPVEFVKKLRKKGFRVSLWQMPYIAAEAEQHDLAKENKYIGRVQTTREQGGSNFSALDYAGTIDFTNPEATAWYKSLLRELLEMGVACIKTDFGEEIHLDAEYHSMEPRYLNNIYGFLYQKAAFEVTKEVTGDGIIWARAGWAGCQRFPLHWGGDAAATWDGMAGTLKGGLHLGLSGFGFWSHDVPGFHGVPDFMNTVIPDDLYMRWTQFGVFTSHIRYHGTSKREPYHYPNIAALVRRWWKLRYALIPYLLEQSKKTVTTGYPVLRALLMHHPDDKICWHIDDQYYLGDDFLVAPVMNAENRRDIYLPKGEWVHFFSGETYNGGKWLKQHHEALGDMPVWIKQGAELPLYLDGVSCTDDMDMSQTRKVMFDHAFDGIWKLLNLEANE
ncbi:alpha-xylosidase [Negadavirga shengliensis]|uniref:Alpha-xylosidase n=1 Tax=Negadavirga shengliensis TaxID=1389218 RepID=A0ABV9T4W4_9BACT